MALDDYVALASQETGVSEGLLRSVMNTESGGRQTDDNGQTLTSSAGALGAMQLMPETAQEMGVDPHDVKQNILGGAKYLKKMLDYYGGDVTKAVAAYNAGAGAVDKHGGVPPYQETQEYVQKVLGGDGAGTDPASFFFHTGMGAFGTPAGTERPQDPKEPVSVWQEAKDKFLNNFYDKGTISAVRTGWSAIESMAQTGDWHVPGFSNYTPSQDEVDMVNKTLGDDDIAKQFVLMNAGSSQHLAKLLQMKREDLEREQRVSQYGWGLVTTPISALGALLDPLVALPIGQEAIGMKALGNLGKRLLSKGATAEKLGADAYKRIGFLPKEAIQDAGVQTLASRVGTSVYGMSQAKIARYSEMAIQNMAAFGTDQWIAEKYGGFKPNYEGAMVMGALAGVFGGIVKDLKVKGTPNKGLARLEETVDNMETHSIANALDGLAPSEITANIRNMLSKLHDTNVEKSVVKEGSEAQQLIKNGRVFILSKEDATKLAQKLGYTLKDDWKAFDIPGGRMSIINKDHVTAENIDGIVKHEVGVHAGLKAFLGEQKYNNLMDEVMKRIKNPQTDEWKKAVKNGGDPEEILGHWIEQNPKGKLFDQLKGRIKKSLGNENVTDDELKDLVNRSVQHQIYEETPIRIDKDGNMSVHGIRYSSNNIFNMNAWAEYFDATGLNMANAQKDLPWGFRKLGRTGETGWLFKTPFGVLYNSKTKMGKNLAEALGVDARQRARKAPNAMPVEKAAEHIVNREKEMYGEYWNMRNKYMWDTVSSHGVPSPYRMRQIDEDVIKCLNAKYAGNDAGLVGSFPKEIEAMADQIKKIHDDLWDLAKKPSEHLGGVKGQKSLVDPRRTYREGEFYRVTDSDKMTEFVGKYFKSAAEDAEEFLTEYARRFVKRDKVIEKLQQEKDLVYDDALQAWNKLPPAKQQAKIAKGETPPQREIVTPEEVDTWIETESANWAKGQIDGERSLATIDGDAGRFGNNADCFRDKFPMDTSGKMDLPNQQGVDFVFDRDVRLMSIDRIMPLMIKRTAGEISLNNTFGNRHAQKAVFDKFAVELEQAVGRPGGISAPQAQKELDALRIMVDKIRGHKSFGDPMSPMDAISETIRTKTYSDVGGNMMFAQLGELGGAIAYNGLRILESVVPSLSHLHREAIHGKQMTELVEEVTKRAFGDQLMNRIWSDSASYESRVYREVSKLGSKYAKAGDTINGVARVMGKVTSQLNMLPSLTNRMINESRLWTTLDSIQWANGEKFRLRNPFSEWNLKAIGIKDAPAELKLKEDIKKYIGSGQMRDKEWVENDPTTYFQWKMLVDYNSQRAFMQNTIGNMSILKDANWFTRLFFQFKDYTFKAVNGQTLRALSSRQASDGLAALFSMGTNIATYIGLVHARAYARFPHDEQTRKDYIKQNLTPARLAFAGFTRGALTGSIPGFGSDIFEIATGTPMFRTTVDNSLNPHQKPAVNQATNGREKFYEIAKNIGKQIPSTRGIGNMVQAPIAGYHLATGRGSQQDIQDIMSIVPLNGWVGMSYLGSEVKDHNKNLPPKMRKLPPTKLENSLKQTVDKYF